MRSTRLKRSVYYNNLKQRLCACTAIVLLIGLVVLGVCGWSFTCNAAPAPPAATAAPLLRPLFAPAAAPATAPPPVLDAAVWRSDQ